MKLFIQVPCLNEEATLGDVLKDLPTKIAGISSIEVLIIDDGSTDKTIEVAKKHGVKHFVQHNGNKGLALSFRDGLWYCLEHGADIIVNTDGDNQYPGNKIADLVKPIIDRRADMVIADRQTNTIDHFGLSKKILQRFGTWVLNKAAGTKVPDAPSGFRAYSRDAALKLNVVTRFSYAMETLIQAGQKGLTIVSIPIVTNPKTRESRLFKNMFEHVFKSGTAIAKAFIMYRPYAVFFTTGGFLTAAGLVPFVRYLTLLHQHGNGRHLQSLILGTVLLTAAFISFTLGVVAGLIHINRSLNEDILELEKRQLLKG